MLYDKPVIIRFDSLISDLHVWFSYFIFVVALYVKHYAIFQKSIIKTHFLFISLPLYVYHVHHHHSISDSSSWISLLFNYLLDWFSPLFRIFGESLTWDQTIYFTHYISIRAQSIFETWIIDTRHTAIIDFNKQFEKMLNLHTKQNNKQRQLRSDLRYETSTNKLHRKYLCEEIHERMTNGLCIFCEEQVTLVII